MKNWFGLGMLVFVIASFDAAAYMASITKVDGGRYKIQNNISDDLKCKVRLGNDSFFVKVPAKGSSKAFKIAAQYHPKSMSLYCKEVVTVKRSKSKMWRNSKYASGVVNSTALHY